MKIKFDRIKKFFERLPWIFGKNAFLTAICLIVFSLILGAFVFYKYSILSQKVEFKAFEFPLQFNEKNYQGLLKTWQERETEFNQIDLKQYSNPFQLTK